MWMHGVQESPGLHQGSGCGPHRNRQEEAESGVNLDSRAEKQRKLNGQTEVKVSKSKREAILKNKRGRGDKEPTAERNNEAGEEGIKSSGKSQASGHKGDHKRSI